MQFLIIIGIGALVAVWVVANQPKARGRRGWYDEDVVSLKPKPVKPFWNGELDEVYSTDEFDYIRKLGRHQDDPRRWPAPLPPTQPKKVESEFFNGSIN